HRAVLPGGGSRRKGRRTGRLRAALAEAGYRPADAFRAAVTGLRRTGARLAALPHAAPFCGATALPPPPDLPAFWRDAALGNVRSLRRVRRHVGVDHSEI